MEKKRYAIIMWIAIALMTGLATSASADSDCDSDSDSEAIVGSWEAVSTLQSGEVAPGLFTFNSDGTWIASAGDLVFSNGHGAWEQTGPGTFSGTNKGFIFDSNGTVSVKNRVTLTVGSDCGGFTAVFETEISLFDGTVIDVFTGTSVGTRIEVEPL